MGYPSGFLSCFSVLACVVELSAAQAFDRVEEFEREFPVKSFGTLEISNVRGGIRLQGWSQDRIRVRAARTAKADSDYQLKKLLAAMDLRQSNAGGTVQISAIYGVGLTLQERLVERRSPSSQMELEVWAPFHMVLKVWTLTGSVAIKNWGAAADIRTSRGDVTVDGLKGKLLSVFCDDCKVRGERVQAALHVTSERGRVTLVDAAGPNIYVESSRGGIELARVVGHQIYVSNEAPISGTDLDGAIEFSTEKGAVDLVLKGGSVSGRSARGDVHVKVARWIASERSFIETAQGAIDLVLPQNFSGELDVWSVLGKVFLSFPLDRSDSGGIYGPKPAHHFVGHVGEGGELVKLFSKHGNIRVSRLRI